MEFTKKKKLRQLNILYHNEIKSLEVKEIKFKNFVLDFNKFNKDSVYVVTKYIIQTQGISLNALAC